MGRKEWMLIDLQEEMTVTAVVTQGRANDEHQRVKNYKVATSLDGDTFSFVPESPPCRDKDKCAFREGKVFNGNVDEDGDKKGPSVLPTPGPAQFVRIYPVDDDVKHKHVLSMRAGVKVTVSKATDIEINPPEWQRIFSSHLPPAQSMLGSPL